MSTQHLFTVAIAGRTNVGKSSLFNRLATQVKSLVYDQDGVTRDTILDTVSWQGVTFQLCDTAGIGEAAPAEQELHNKVQERAIDEFQNADLVLLMIDGKVGVIKEDLLIARMLKKTKKTVKVVVNKVDTVAQYDTMVHEAVSIGFGEGLGISAQHGTGIADLLEYIVTVIKSQQTDQPQAKSNDSAYKVVILGKPNVGKSSLLNALTEKERAVVTNIPGTTREALDEHITFYKAVIKITDTPGVRKKRSVNEPLEELMVKSTMHALKRADIVLLMLDASYGNITDQELKLLFYAFTEQHKSLILLLNKHDIVDESMKISLTGAFKAYQYIIKKLPQLTISCTTGYHIGKVMPLVQEVYNRSVQKFSDYELTILLKGALSKKPLFYQQQELVLHEVKQIKTNPLTFLLVVNQSHLFGETQKAFFEGILRKEYNLLGVPVVLIARTKK